jgi:hypothetical protein
MRYFLEDFENVYNKDWPFGFFPAHKYYPKTGTHIGTDFKVAKGTPIFVPTDGEMFKIEINKYKGNVGIFVFEHKGVTWGLELCHLKDLPKKGAYKESEVIAYSGNTGAATTGAHLHAVLHRDAMVTKNYQKLQSREDFLQLEKEGAIVDCFKWFCDSVRLEPERQPKTLEINISETINVRDNVELKTFWGSVGKFIAHMISGWFPSNRTDLSPDGVQKERIVDRANNRYKEKVVDVKTERIIRDIDEKLTEHKK